MKKHEEKAEAEAETRVKINTDAEAGSLDAATAKVKVVRSDIGSRRIRQALVDGHIIASYTDGTLCISVPGERRAYSVRLDEAMSVIAASADAYHAVDEAIQKQARDAEAVRKADAEAERLAREREAEEQSGDETRSGLD